MAARLHVDESVHLVTLAGGSSIVTLLAPAVFVTPNPEVRTVTRLRA